MTRKEDVAQSVEARIEEIIGDLNRLARAVRKDAFLNSDDYGDCSPSDLTLTIAFTADELEELVREWEKARG